MKFLKINFNKVLIWILATVIILNGAFYNPHLIEAASVTHTTDADFNVGIHSSTTVSGTGSAASVKLAFDSNTKLLLHINGTSGSQVFTDSTDNPKTIAANGNAQISTAQSKFGGASGYFDGLGDYLSVSSSSDWNIGTGDFTIDFWYYADSPSAEAEFFNMAPAYNSTLENTRIKISRDYSYIRGGINGSIVVSNSGGVFDANWHHVALVRYSGNVNLFIDGVGITATSNSSSVTNDNLYIGVGNHPEGTIPTTEYWKGYLDEIRVSNGIARWTSNFTPPSAPYGYLSPGVYESATIDLGVQADFSNLDFTVTTNASTAVKFQLAANNGGSVWNYIGPDGTAGTYFTSTGTAIPSSLDNNRYIKYKAYLSTTDATYTPSLDDITITYTYLALIGSLTSSIFDTGISNGAGLNSIMWQGNKPSGTEVNFQIASAATSTGPWDYKGWDGSASSYYAPLDVGVPLQINPAHHNNYRYFRYKIFLYSNQARTQSPRVDDVIINYSL